MRKLYPASLPGILIVFILLFVFSGCKEKKENVLETETENDEYDGPDKAIEFEIERTKDPATGKVPWPKLLVAMERTEQEKNRPLTNSNQTDALTWTERGPDSDVSGPSGNSRPNNDVTAGRIRAVMIDSLDPTHKTVWVGGVDGGLWKSTDITVSPANWTLVNDYLSNLAVSAICQDPRPGFQNNMYFCTGESFRNADAVRGVGAFKSTDGGVTWTYLTSTSAFTSCTRILCDFQGNIYLATRNTGLVRSTNGGTSWTTITPSGAGNNICDLEITSTAVAGRLHMTTGIGSAQTYRYTDIPSTVTSGSGWNAPTTAFPSFNERAEITCSGSVLYALPVNNATNNVPVIYQSLDGGDNWVATATQPGGGTWANGQGWYCISAGINPANSNELIVGGLDCYKTIDGGLTWVKISTWVGFSGQYVHADQHNVQWWDGGNKLLFACDGGIHYSSNGGITIRDRNIGLRLKQFYSVAIHPTLTNYFLAGAQDNGVHQLTNPGMGSSTEVYGGDGCYVAIDQNEPQFQYGSFVYNVYRRSTNGGASWTTPVSLGTTGSNGRFVNPWDYDNNANRIYACYTGGLYLRWDDPQTGSTTTTVAVAAFNGGNVSAVHASPYTPNKVFFGTGAGRVVKVDDANTATPVDLNITPAGAAGYVNCVVTGSSDQNLIACYSNYAVNNVWVSSNGGTSWTAVDGNLPDMPVRWALFHPDADTKAIIATETGVWETDLLNGASTIWIPSANFPNVRTDMIKYRASDRTIAAGTHGRGIWTAIIPASVPGGFTFSSPAPATAICPAPSSMQVTLAATFNTGFTNLITLTNSTVPAGTSIAYATNPLTTGTASTTITLNGTNTLAAGSYSVTITGTATGATTQTRDITFTINAGTGPAIISQPSNQTVCAGATTSFSIAAATASSFQWQLSTDGGGTYISVTNGGIYSGATSNTLTLTGATAGLTNNRYRCSAFTQCGTTTSTAGILTVNTAPLISPQGQPQSVTLCTGSNTTFSVIANGAGLTYQWQISTPAVPAFTTIAGANAAAYIISGATVGMNGNQYRCVVSGTCAPAVISTAALLTVITPTVIVTQPANVELCSGTNASFTVLGTSPQPTIYQWEVSTNGGITWATITGANAATYTVNSVIVAMTNNRYRVQLSNATCPTPVISGSAILTVRPLPLVGLSATLLSLFPGQTTMLTATPGATTGGVITTSWTYNVSPLILSGNTYTATVEKAGAYQMRIQETWPSSLFCSNLSPLVTIDAPASSKLFIFPSPNDGRFTVSYYNNGGTNTSRIVTVYDSRGKRVEYKKFMVSGSYTLLNIDVRPAQKGVYYVVVGDAAGKALADGKVLIH